MANESLGQRLADEIWRSVDGAAWHGPNVREALHGVSAELALWRPAVGSHCVWELALHIAAWHTELLAVVRGRPYRTMPDQEQWPPVSNPSPAAWDALVESLLSANRQLASDVAALSDQALARPIENRDYTLEFLLHGLAQHNSYHGGQIMLLQRIALGS